MFWLICVTVNIQNVLLWLECRHGDVYTTDVSFRPDSRVQHRRVEARLLQRPVVWCTSGDIRQAPACPEQPGQSRLPAPGSHRRQAAAPVSMGWKGWGGVTSLASNATAGHLQSGSADPQGAGHSHSGVSQ